MRCGSRLPAQWRSDKMDYRLAAMILFQREREGAFHFARSKRRGRL